MLEIFSLLVLAVSLWAVIDEYFFWSPIQTLVATVLPSVRMEGEEVDGRIEWKSFEITFPR